VSTYLVKIVPVEGNNGEVNGDVLQAIITVMARRGHNSTVSGGKTEVGGEDHRCIDIWFSKEVSSEP